MQIIPLTPIPAQIIYCILEGQNVAINLYQKDNKMYMDLFNNGENIFKTFRVLTGVNMIRQIYYGFIGGIVMIDTQGFEDPQYEGLNSRWILVYLNESEVK